MNLSEGIAALGLTLPAHGEEKLSAYLSLLVKWNKVYNLTAIRDPDEMMTHHLLDSLSVLPGLEKSVPAGRRSGPALPQPLSPGREDFVRAERENGAMSYRIADVGSGAGLPGLVLAIARPDWVVASIETVEKKAAFQRQVTIELGLSNVSIYCQRVERLELRFDAVISRAFASLADFVGLAGHLADTLWAMKGGYPADEVAALPAGWRVVAHRELRVPGLDAARCLLQLEKS